MDVNEKDKGKGRQMKKCHQNLKQVLLTILTAFFIYCMPVTWQGESYGIYL